MHNKMNTKTFLEYYQGLPTRTDQKELRHRVIRECKIKNSTFYSWLQRGNVPDEKNQKIIAELLDQPVEILFPEFQLQTI